MPLRADYGQAIAATTARLQQVIAQASPSTTVTARIPQLARVGVSGTSVNLFLYRDGWLRYRSGTEPGEPRLIGAELSYLLSTYPAGENAAATNGVDTSLRAYGNARAVVENNPVIAVALPSRASLQVQLTSAALTLEDLTSLWVASAAPLRLSFGITATITMPGERSSGFLDELVARAEPGLVVAFGGPDGAAKASAAAVLAERLSQPLVQVRLHEVVGERIDETEEKLRNLFSRAEGREAVLVLDEADALFGRRGEVRDGHERYTGVDPAAILDLLGHAPGVVLVNVRGRLGGALADGAAMEIRFPPE